MRLMILNSVTSIIWSIFLLVISFFRILVKMLVTRLTNVVKDSVLNTHFFEKRIEVSTGCQMPLVY